MQPAMTRPAVVWLLSPPPWEGPPPSPRLEVVCRDVPYVQPMDMTKDLKGNLILVDQGYSHAERDWRRYPHEFGVVLHFAEAFPEINRTIRAIEDIVQAEKPAGTHFWLRQE